MPLGVQQSTDGHRLVGDGADVELANGFLAHLAVRNYAVASCRGYAYDLLNFLRFLADRGLRLAEVTPTDVFDYLDWQARRRQSSPGSAVVRLADRQGDAPSTINRRIAAVRGLFEYAVTTGVRSTSPVPAARRTSGLRARRGLLGHLPRRHDRDGGRLVREPHRLPDSLSRTEIEGFLGDLATHRDRAMVWLMLLGGLRAGEVRGLRLADVDMGRRQVRIVGKGGRAARSAHRPRPSPRARSPWCQAYQSEPSTAGAWTSGCSVVSVFTEQVPFNKVRIRASQH
jgi:integrase/recombinase XerC